MEGKTPDPPASLNGSVFHVLGEFEHLQSCFGVITQTQKTPQGEGELVQSAAPGAGHQRRHKDGQRVKGADIESARE